MAGTPEARPQAGTRRVAVIGGNRIPFARSNTAYSNASNQDMLTAALDGLVERFDLHGERLGEVVAGAVLKHSRDFNLTRETVLGSALSADTPAYDIQQACDTGMQATVAVANKIALGKIEVGVAGGADTTSDAPIAVNERLRKILLEANRAKTTKGRIAALLKIRPGHLAPAIPQNSEPRTGLSMGESQALTSAEWDISREDQDALAVASHHELAAAYDRGFMDDLMSPFLGLERDQNLRADSSVEKLAALKPVFGQGAAATMTAANSTPLTDGASTVLLASQGYADARGWQPLAYLTDYETAAVDYVHGGEGLLMAPAYAMPRMLARHGIGPAGLRLLRGPRGFRVAGPVDAEGVGGPDLLQAAARAGRATGIHRPRQAQRAWVPRSRPGHPFAATGGRIVATLAKLLAEKGTGRGVISICAAGGQGVTAILQR
ncbi:MAG: acetyl-CoA C-acetyltransferase [Nocardioidaceae bacterium]